MRARRALCRQNPERVPAALDAGRVRDYIRSGTLMPAFPTPVAASENQSVHSLLVPDSKVAPAHEIGTKVSRQLGRCRRILSTC